MFNIALRTSWCFFQARIGQPEIDSILAWDPPRHLFAFTPKSLAAIGVRFGRETEIFVGYNTNRLFEPRQYV